MKNIVIGILVFLLVIAIGAIAFFIGSQENPPIEKTVQVTLDIRPSPDFTLEVSPLNIITYPNRVVPFNVLCTGVNDFAGVVTISIEGLPTGITAEYFPSDSFTLGLEQKGVQINLTVQNDQVLVGIHALTVKAVSTNYN